eukprot:5302459-Prorocentrum_lima.AAC.1
MTRCVFASPRPRRRLPRGPGRDHHVKVACQPRHAKPGLPLHACVCDPVLLQARSHAGDNHGN